MRKLLCIILALSMLAGCTAMAEANWIMYNFGDFNLSFPDDIVCGYTEERVANQPFLMFYQDYDETAPFMKNFNVVWNDGVNEIGAMDPEAVGGNILNALLTQFASMGVACSNDMLLSAETIDYVDKTALGIAYTVTVDYSALNGGPVLDLVFVQLLFSDEAFGTYNFTITTDDINNTQLLMDIIDTLSWNV